MDQDQAGPSSPLAANEVYEQEVLLENIFQKLADGFRRADKLTGAKQAALLKELTAQMQEAKALIRDFEREAHADGVDPGDITRRKRVMVADLNAFIARKKAYAAQTAARSELLGDAAEPGGSGGMTMQQQYETKSSVELMEMGRRHIRDTDASLMRSQRYVSDTIAVGAQTAETLQSQGRQLEKVMDDLDEIHFTMRKARQVMRDITRGLATDKCILLLLLLVMIGIVVIIVLKIVGVDNIGL